MSWSVSLLGTPEGVSKKLDEIGTGMADGQSKDEYMEAAPHLQGLIAQAVGPNVNIKLAASGHATFTDGKKTYGNISVSLEILYGEWCT